jgi:hypothetical protein
MSKTYKCPACQNEVDAAATVCCNAACRAALAFCPHCRDITTYVLADRRKGTMVRDSYRCDRCQGLGVKCYTWLSGGYCNGLARTGDRVDRPLCPTCSGKFSEMARSVVSWTLIGAFGGMFKKK